MAAPPPRPLLIFDGDCSFCVRSARRWQRAAGDRVDGLSFLDVRVAAQFPELRREQLATAIHLVQPDGAVFTGAEAAFRALAHNPRRRWLLNWYEHSPAFARAAEWAYRLVAARRRGIGSVHGDTTR